MKPAEKTPKALLKSFHSGTEERAYEFFGAHLGPQGAVLRVWAPHAEYASVCGDFNGWDPQKHPMQRLTPNGIWELTLPLTAFPLGSLYKFYFKNGERESYKADPYGVSMQLPPETASVFADLDGYCWRDDGWLGYRRRYARETVMEQPLNIYEVHLGSWRRHEDGSFFSYAELARELAPYVKQMGYTHIELMPIAEFPFNGSWGYQACGYYAPTARYGSPKDFMAFVDSMHEAGIGVILDWVPAHFPKDAHGLYEFDGQPLYEYQELTRMERPSWGTRCFDVGRPEVQSFLISNAFYWIEKYHIDGLRVDAVTSMLYLDYDRPAGEWLPNIYGDNRCLEAVSFFKSLNQKLARAYPAVMTIAEESTAWAHVTGLEEGGLGFSLKWNMGWMNDTLSYVRIPPEERRYHHQKLNFSLTYAFAERFVLPLSHDEVVHGKKSLLDRMPGTYEQKFAGARLLLAYQMTHPGKKLLFMSSELGQFREWDFDGEAEWFLLDYEMHAKFQYYVSKLNHFYLAQAALWERDRAWIHGFEWIDADNSQQSILTYRRMDAAGRELIVLLNFLPQRWENYVIAVPYEGIYEEIFNSDATEFGGAGDCNTGQYRTEPCHIRKYTQGIRITVPALGAAVFRCVRRSPQKRSDTKH